MRWLKRLFGTVLALLLGILLVLWLSLQWRVTAAWVLSHSLSGLFSVPVQVQGEVNVEVWPQLRLQIETMRFCAQAQSVCTQFEDVVSIDEAHAQDVEFVASWRGLLTRDMEVSWLGARALDVVVAEAKDLQAQRHPQVDGEWFHQWLQNRFVSFEAIDLQNVQVRHVPSGSDIESLFMARRLRLAIQAQASQSDWNLILDDVQIATPFLQQWDLASTSRLFAQTLRADLTFDENLMQIRQIDLIGGNVRAEGFKGWVNLQNQTMSVQFKLDAELLNQSASASGFQIQLRERLLPVRISGPWSQPTVQAGESARASPSAGTDP